MGNHFGYTINGPQFDSVELPFRLSKSLSVRREPKISENNLRNLYQNPVSSPDHRASISSIDNGLPTPATPVLPPTPPNVEDELDGRADEPVSSSEVVKARSMLATPVQHISPPTPDNTPPRDKSRLRPFLGAQPSMASTRAESFKTAREELTSDQESVASSPILQPHFNRSTSLLPPLLLNGVHKPSPLANLPITNGDMSSGNSSPAIPSLANMPVLEERHIVTEGIAVNERDATIAHDLVFNEECNINGATLTPVQSERIVETHVRSRKEGLRQGESLRERLEDTQRIPNSPSIDKFASIIGWSSSVHDSIHEQRRLSEASNTSTVEAFLIEPPRVPKKRNTLRHVSKNDSLRSTSSPLPNSNRTSMQSSSESPHRLVHKKAKLGNHNRLSFGSGMSHPMSTGSYAVPKVEVIKVAVIPERSSSLQQSAASSRRHSLSVTGAPTSFRARNMSDASQKKGTMTDVVDRGRDRHYPPQVPARGSSLSAPTSRNTSRANSITSDHVRFERKRAENDLRTTLDRMESARLTSSLMSGSVDPAPLQHEARASPTNARTHNFANGAKQHQDHVTPGTREWADLRPTSTIHTPFSLPSFMSASPEISEAKMISLHVHNNYSVQLIEPFSLHESEAVEEARKLNKGNYVNGKVVDSPLRNPRRPPNPPRVRFTPATPQHELQVQLGFDTPAAMRPSTPKRPANRQRTDSFKTLLRNVSLKNARNKKADQDLDSSLHPFWRPRPFWDNIEPTSPEKKRDVQSEERGIVNNSLGLPQQRVVITGPLELVRKFSERRRNRRVIVKQSSYGSLQRFRAGRKMYRLPNLGVHLHVLSLREIQDRVVAVRQRREDEKREKRREALRKSIGPNVIATGDSRFLATVMADSSLQREHA